LAILRGERVACEIVDLGEVKQPFPPATQGRRPHRLCGGSSWGIASLILVVILDIVVAAALLTVFAPVNRSVSTMAAWFRARP
jgi:hypothetical protein